MMLTNRKWEELDAFNSEDENSFVDAAEDTDNFSEGGASAAGRRAMIEQALSRVKEVSKSPLDAKRKYSTGALVFVAEHAKFGRVKKSPVGILKVELLAGGTLSYDGGEMPSLKVEKTSKSTKETPDLERKSHRAAAAEPTPIKENKAKNNNGKSAAKLESKTLAPAVTEKAAAKNKVKQLKTEGPKTGKIKSAPKKSAKVAAAKPSSREMSANPWTELQLDPIADPNGYIKQNYPYLSNKQLAGLTGLSEHTIRRKLGEWGLKRSLRK